MMMGLISRLIIILVSRQKVRVGYLDARIVGSRNLTGLECFVRVSGRSVN